MAAIVEPVDARRLLVARVLHSAREAGISDLTELPGQGPQNLLEQSQYRGKQNYVLEIVLTDRVVTAVGQYDSPYYSLGFSARGRIVRVADSAVLRTFRTTAATPLMRGEAFAADNGRLIEKELGNALDQLAKASVDQWTRVAFDASCESDAAIVINRGVRRATSLMLRWTIDGCDVGDLERGSSTRFSVLAGRHIVAVKSTRPYTAVSVDLKPGETRHLSLDFRMAGSNMLYPALTLSGEGPEEEPARLEEKRKCEESVRSRRLQ